MKEPQLPYLSIGDDIPAHRLGRGGHSGTSSLLGRPVRLDISGEALGAIDAGRPILAQVELYFSCMIRKQVRFLELPAEHNADHNNDDDSWTTVIPGLLTGFRAVTTRACHIADLDGKPPTEVMPITHPDRFVPDWLRIDFRDGQWRGQFGFDHRRRRMQPQAPAD